MVAQESENASYIVERLLHRRTPHLLQIKANLDYASFRHQKMRKSHITQITQIPCVKHVRKSCTV